MLDQFLPVSLTISESVQTERLVGRSFVRSNSLIDKEKAPPFGRLDVWTYINQYQEQAQVQDIPAYIYDDDDVTYKRTNVQTTPLNTDITGYSRLDVDVQTSPNARNSPCYRINLNLPP